MVGDYISMGGVTRKIRSMSGGVSEKPEDILLTTIIPSLSYPEGNLSFRAVYAYPIPLTEDLMAKNFPDYDSGYQIGWWLNEDKQSFQVEWQDDNAEVILKKVKYVHELQHLLNLLGIHKEITL